MEMKTSIQKHRTKYERKTKSIWSPFCKSPWTSWVAVLLFPDLASFSALRRNCRSDTRLVFRSNHCTSSCRFVLTSLFTNRTKRYLILNNSQTVTPHRSCCLWGAVNKMEKRRIFPAVFKYRFVYIYIHAYSVMFFHGASGQQRHLCCTVILIVLFCTVVHCMVYLCISIITGNSRDVCNVL